MAKTKRGLPTIGVDRYTFAKVEKDDENELVYGEVYHLKGTVQISPTDSGGNDTFDADNGPYEVESYIENIGHELTSADIPPEVDAMWRGLEMKNGAVIVGGISDVPYFGVAWRVLKSNGTYRYFKCFKGKYSFASNVGGETKPSSGAANKQTATATYTAVRREHDDMYYTYIDLEQVQELVTKGKVASVQKFEELFFGYMNYLPGDENYISLFDDEGPEDVTPEDPSDGE